MDNLYEQMGRLIVQVDSLSQSIDRLNHRLSVSLPALVPERSTSYPILPEGSQSGATGDEEAIRAQWRARGRDALAALHAEAAATLGGKLGDEANLIDDLNGGVQVAEPQSLSRSPQTLEAVAGVVDDDSEVIADLKAELKQTPTCQGILNDDKLEFRHHPSSHSSGTQKALTHEIQSQRLMAQLTAAYNRIAELEERLIAQRMQ